MNSYEAVALVTGSLVIPAIAFTVASVRVFSDCQDPKSPNYHNYNRDMASGICSWLGGVASIIFLAFSLIFLSHSNPPTDMVKETLCLKEEISRLESVLEVRDRQILDLTGTPAGDLPVALRLTPPVIPRVGPIPLPETIIETRPLDMRTAAQPEEKAEKYEPKNHMWFWPVRATGE